MTHIISNMKPFIGRHCETSATGTLLKHIGIDFSEPMLFGIGEGLGFIFWSSKAMDYPFMGGRIKQDLLTRNITSNLNLQLEVKETTSIKKAWENVKTKIDEDIPVALKLDCYYLDYFQEKIHFAGHYVTLYGYDENDAYLTDTNLSDTILHGTPLKTSLHSLELARKEKGPLSSNQLSYTIQRTDLSYHIKEVIISSIKRNADDYLHPPIKNVGYLGIQKASQGIKQWYTESKDIRKDFSTIAMLMEEGGTGGALFRNLYRDFLKESYELLRIDKLNEAFMRFEEIALMWTNIAGLFKKTAEEADMEYIDQASRLLLELSHKEKSVMELLSTL